MEGDAGTRRLNPTDAKNTPDESVAASEQEQTDHADQNPAATEAVEEVSDVADRRPSRLGRGWLVGICAGLLILTIAAVVGGVFAIR